MAINVTKSFLPPQEEYQKLLNDVWESRWLTNNGKFTIELEEKLKKFLGVKHLFYVNNGTIALMIAIKALELKGSVLTTPFSYVATTSSLVWENIEPVFVDISEEDLNMDINKIESAIRPDTTAILTTHVYGNQCKVEQIEQIARKHKLKVIYDAAHAFDVKYKGQSILNFGDISTLSFHSTKLFHTVEGGAIITNDDDLAHKISYLRNFGHNGPLAFHGLGINGKNSEFHAAMGLCNLNYVESNKANYKRAYHYYLNNLKSEELQFQKICDDEGYNHSYFPIVFKSEAQLLKTQGKLNENDIFPRRYFFPSLNKLPYIPYKECPVAERISERVLCLPMFYDITESIQDQIIKIIKSTLGS